MDDAVRISAGRAAGPPRTAYQVGANPIGARFLSWASMYRGFSGRTEEKKIRLEASPGIYIPNLTESARI